MCLTTNTEDCLALYYDAYELLKDLPSDVFPEDELAWLVSTCYNHGCDHAKLGQNLRAKNYLEVALRLLEFCPKLEAFRKVQLRSNLQILPTSVSSLDLLLQDTEGEEANEDKEVNACTAWQAILFVLAIPISAFLHTFAPLSVYFLSSACLEAVMWFELCVFGHIPPAKENSEKCYGLISQLERTMQSSLKLTC